MEFPVLNDIATWLNSTSLIVGAAAAISDRTAVLITSVTGVVSATGVLVGTVSGLLGKPAGPPAEALPDENPEDEEATIRLPEIKRIARRQSSAVRSNRLAAISFAVATIVASIYFVAPVVIAIQEQVPVFPLVLPVAIGLLICLCWLLERQLPPDWLTRRIKRWSMPYWTRLAYHWVIPAVVVLATIYVAGPAISIISRGLASGSSIDLPVGQAFLALVGIAMAICWLLERMLRPLARARAAEVRLAVAEEARDVLGDGLEKRRKDRLNGPSLGRLQKVATKAIEEVLEAESKAL